MPPYLYEHQNPHAPQRSNGRRMWAYPTRTRLICILVAHTAENMPDLHPPDLGAESVARYFSETSRPASAHVNVDSDSTIVCLPDEATAFAAIDFNAGGWHCELCTQAHRWDDLPAQFKDRLLRRAAPEFARRARRYGIPVRLITREQAASAIAHNDPSAGGIVGHHRLDPDRRSDPGEDFPWRTFLGYIRDDDDIDPPDGHATPLLRRGHEGAYVQRAARLLIDHGYKANLTNASGRVTRRFNAAMEHQVRRFQKTHGLDVDGLVGPDTWRHLREEPQS